MTELTLACVPVSNGGIVTHGSVTRTCVRCGTAVWVAPSSVEIIAEKGAAVACVPCALAHFKPDDDEIVPLSERQLAEAIASIEGHQRRN